MTDPWHGTLARRHPFDRLLSCRRGVWILGTDTALFIPRSALNRRHGGGRRIANALKAALGDGDLRLDDKGRYVCVPPLDPRSWAGIFESIVTGDVRYRLEPQPRRKAL
jgi:hypothetical protein